MNIEAFILIGGESSRMGRDKAFIELGGVSLAAKTLSTLRAAELFSNVTFAAAHQAQFAIPAVVLDAPFILDIYPGRGPLSGMHTALANARSEWIFVTACDYPFTTSELIKVLAKAISDEYGAVVPEQPDGRLQPLFAFYRVEAAKPVINEIAEKPKAAPPMRDLVALMNPLIVRPAEYSHLNDCERLFHNVNTPHDLADSIPRG